MKKKKNNCKLNYRLLIMMMIMLLLFISNCYFIYSLLCLVGIETLIRITIIFILILLFLCFEIRYLRSYVLKKKRFNIYTIILLIYAVVLIMIGIFIQNTLNTLNNLTSDKTTYSVSLVALSTEDNNNVKNITEKI